MEDDNRKLNEGIEQAISEFDKDETYDNLSSVMDALFAAMKGGSELFIPVDLSQETIDKFEKDDHHRRNAVTGKEEMSFTMRQIPLEDNKSALVAFTSQSEVNKGQQTSIILNTAMAFFESVAAIGNSYGVIINPWGTSFYVTPEMIKMLVDAAEPRSSISFKLGDITQLDCQCIVNAANPSLLGGGGVDGAIHAAAGPKLLEECRGLGGCETGQAKITKGYNLKAQHVIHTVGPIYSGKESDADLLRACYINSLDLARNNDIHSIAFPAISTGVYGYPIEEAVPVALMALSDWLNNNSDYIMEVVICCYDQKTYDMYHSFINNSNPPSADTVQ